MKNISPIILVLLIAISCKKYPTTIKNETALKVFEIDSNTVRKHLYTLASATFVPDCPTAPFSPRAYLVNPELQETLVVGADAAADTPLLTTHSLKPAPPGFAGTIVDHPSAVTP